MKSFPQLRLLFLLLAFLIPISAHAQDTMKRWQDFDFAATPLKSADLAAVPLEDLKLIRGIVFGRHGRIFKDAEIKTFLEAQDWYKPNAEFSNAMLNARENQNLDLIRDAEARKHTTVQPGDMRYWRTRTLTARKLGVHSGAE